VGSLRFFMTDSLTGWRGKSTWWTFRDLEQGHRIGLRL